MNSKLSGSVPKDGPWWYNSFLQGRSSFTARAFMDAMANAHGY